MTPQEELAKKLSFEAALLRDLRAYFRDLNAYVVRGIRRNGAVPFFTTNQREELRVILLRHYRKVGNVFSRNVRASNGMKQRHAHLLTKNLDDNIADELELFATITTVQRAVSIMETNRKVAVASLADALDVLIAQQEEIVAANMARESARVLNERTKARLPMIATTETQNAAEGAKRIEAENVNEEADVEVVFKTWNTILDGRERDTHRTANGQRVNANDFFTVGGDRLMYPGDTSLGAGLDEIINCRCSASYDVERNS